MGRNTILTKERLELIPLLIKQGKVCEDIAIAFGVTPGTLRVQCSRNGISLKRQPPPLFTAEIRPVDC